MGHIPDEELVSVYRVQRDHWKAIWKARAKKAERENEGLKNGSRDLMLINSKMVTALDAADRLADLVVGESDERCQASQTYPYAKAYQEARAAVGKAGGD
jgi:hypothetical protein